jgi:hypothetical protein
MSDRPERIEDESMEYWLTQDVMSYYGFVEPGEATAFMKSHAITVKDSLQHESNADYLDDVTYKMFTPKNGI